MMRFKLLGWVGGLVILLAILVAIGFALHSQRRVPGWTVSCREGTDEFARSCKAELNSGGALVVMQTGDSQLFLNVEAPDCAAQENSAGDNWWRDELIGLSDQERRKRLSDSIMEAQRKVKEACPSVAVTRIEVTPAADIAVAGS